MAEKAAVSYQTVSKVLNGNKHVLPETEARIWQAAKELGYKPSSAARNLRTQRSRMIGFSWIPIQPGQVNTIIDLFMASMVAEAEQAGYHLLPFPYREGDAQVESYRELINSVKVDGFVLTSVNYHDPRIQFLLEQSFPFVAFGRSDAALEFPFVDVDGAQGLRLATEHLLSRGRRRMAVLGWREDSRVGNERMEGYYAAMQAAGIRVQPGWIARGEGTFDFARNATRPWLNMAPDQRPDGILALNDTMAIGAMHAIQEHGMTVGRDISIIGFDDAPMVQYLRPALTTIRQPIREAGRRCAEILIALLLGQEPPERHVLLKPELVIRDSA